MERGERGRCRALRAALGSLCACTTAEAIGCEDKDKNVQQEEEESGLFLLSVGGLQAEREWSAPFTSRARSVARVIQSEIYLASRVEVGAGAWMSPRHGMETLSQLPASEAVWEAWHKSWRSGVAPARSTSEGASP
eukprot:scaffold194847_cov30-Tisochrysis_lutea.AAC.3